MPVDWERNQRLVRRLSRMLGKISRKPQPEAVHQFRTTARRLESVLDALAPTPDRSQRKLLKQLGRVRSRAGRLRDVDVQIAALSTVKLTTETTRKQRLMKVLTELRGRRERKLLQILEAGDLRKLRRRLRQSAADLGITPRAVAHEVASASACPRPQPAVEPVREALRRFAAIARDRGPLTEESLHAYRMKGKRIRYLAEMAGDDPAAQAIVAELKRMQDAIGEWHDWWALAGTADKVFAEPQPCSFVLALRNIMHAKFDEGVRVATEVRRELLARHRSLPKRAAPARAPRPANAASA